MAAWTDAENDLIVADYFAMLADDTARRPYNKAEHNRDLQAATGRSRTSIEYKHQNISAVLVGMGEEWIAGYKPAFNFQMTLVDAVARWLALNPPAAAGRARADARHRRPLRRRRTRCAQPRSRPRRRGARPSP